MKNLRTFLLVFLLMPALLNAQLERGIIQACLDLRTGKILMQKYCGKALGPVIWGIFINRNFDPSKRIEHAERAKDPDPKYSPGWIELYTGEIHFDTEKRKPEEPYLRGMIDTNKEFYVYPDELKRWAEGKKNKGDDSN